MKRLLPFLAAACVPVTLASLVRWPLQTVIVAFFAPLCVFLVYGFTMAVYELVRDWVERT